MNNLEKEEYGQPKDPDDEDAPIRDDEPGPHQDICQSCNSPILDLGIEAADEYRSARRWHKCGCGVRSVILGPPMKPKQYDDIEAWHRRQRMMR